MAKNKSRSMLKRLAIQAGKSYEDVENKISRLWLSCSLCPPNQDENAGRRPKHGAKKSKQKNKRK